MKKLRFTSFFIIPCLICLIHANIAVGFETKKWPDSISNSIEHLLKLSDPGKHTQFDEKTVTALLEFIQNPIEKNKVILNSGDSAYPSAHYRFDIQRSLKEVIQYGFNPKISSVLARPSSIRLSYWTKSDGPEKGLPKLWPYLEDLSKPVVLKGLEHTEITPDTNSGTYFSYDMYRTVILLKHNGHKVMISLSHQKDKSEVGKKGLILGPDENWDYVYTGEEGVNKLGLGWVRSRIYKSHNIMILYENNEASPSVRCAVFNWIQAGWAGINMVNNEHIYNGIIRFATDFKAILENSTLPEPDELANQLARFEQMPTDELRNRTHLYLEKLEKRYASSDKQLAKLLENKNYIKQLNREEMVSTLIKEYTKVLIGKQPAETANYLFGQMNEKRLAKQTLSQ